MKKSLDPAQCYACSPANQRGLQLQFSSNPDGVWSADWNPDADFQGFSGVIHGGIVSTVLDEAMAKAVAGTGSYGFTTELRVRFREHVAPGAELKVEGWIAENGRRMIKTEAHVLSADGRELAHGWGTFLAAK